MRVLIIGHACSPRRGSEPSFTWNWAWHLSRHHQVWVVAHPHDRRRIEMFLREHPNRHLTFHWVELPGYFDPWNPGSHDRGLRLHYLFWLPRAYQKANELQQQIGFDIAQHVSYGSVSVPPPARKLGVPFIWGPIGGGQQAPPSFRRYFGPAWPREVLRNARIRLLPFSPSLRNAARASAVTLATNHETANLLGQIGARDVRLCLDSGVSPEIVSTCRIPRSNGEKFTLLWVGRMQPRKALPLALEALAEVADVNVQLLIAGDGEMRRSWENYARALCLENRVEFLGALPWDKMPGVYQRADAFLFTSLRDSFGTQVLEAMGHALPILTLDHQGAATFVPPDAAIKVPPTTPHETIRGLADGIRQLAQNPGARRRLGEAGRAFAETQTWEKRAEWMAELYEEALSMRGSPKLSGPASYGSYGVKKTASAPETGQKMDPRLPDAALRFDVLGVRVDATQIEGTVARMESWIHNRNTCRSIAATDMHGIVEAQRDPHFKELLNSTDLVVPDGMPLVWFGRRQGHTLPRRVYGPDLMLAFCEITAARGYRHFFFGGEPGVAERLASSLQARFPGLQVAGTFSPPFRPLSEAEDNEIISLISRAGADVVWVGLGAPKQERWMHTHRGRLQVPVLVGVGAAFDILSGRRRQAPRWMREHGLEWLFRLLQEPRRLWRRYLIYGGQFVIDVIVDQVRRTAGAPTPHPATPTDRPTNSSET